ncbi:MAG: excinuclease ABC subunit B [Candidatus Levybacteria bacterium RIFOXYA1_FULL_41_10]|nr:MAG: UvrABC system protein B [Candidatus Levybacteria bacterium GW2011_GWC1_40_19]KKR72050.1 MAG: UvrABC system protein B [Candidatus Levybacteria bacterium GW2011_GWC2_40_7]KKR95254.1 MAG: UvrABC system protein B [Candidatus Levybacteria bacterium GW2011_GWA2_41_15]OGH25163.1 MAG: excinuclease ABC subunit B [Candidatus Levybacteria bacterium RIFCSPHIGHO2_02_FULL_40_29]OGH50334.1 MAG: excinuclease ABC subunit B [Candidatus Levybacteria bacterium RIFCSPLOWO2_02_FULL_40_18]OGH52238.1 MAG: exc
MNFKVKSGFKPAGDQPQAIDKLIQSIKEDNMHQVLLGVTGSGKTFTMANVIEKLSRPTLIISHNKTLAAQLYQEFRDFFPGNAVSYFVSYYDYYQPEAYIPHSDTYIEKESEINEEIDKLRLAATMNLLTRKDVIVVASVSSIYNIGAPLEYGKFVLEIAKGSKTSQKDVILRLADLQYDRNDYGFKRGTFRIRGESIDLFPAYQDTGLRIEIESEVITDISEFDPLTGDDVSKKEKFTVYPAKHFMTDPATYKNVFPQINKDLEERVGVLKKQGKILEAQRLTQRTNYDLEMIKEVGYVNGIENYSRYFDGRSPGDPPFSLLDYFEEASKEWLCIIDESHITLPQIRGMYNGDRSRKETLIEYGFRLPSALDNRPLRFEEFMQRTHQKVYVSATPDEYEISLSKESGGITEQLVRPTGLIDPKVTVKPTKGQVEDLIREIAMRVKKGQRVLVTTLTKRMAEDLSFYLSERDIKVSYLHSDIATLDRQDELDKLRSGDYDVLVGINLLREGLDLPEVSLVAILDADKEGFLRSKTSLIQIMGRAARHVESEVIMYADNETGSMREAIKEVDRRRQIQIDYNREHGITPIGIQKAIRARLVEEEKEDRKSAQFILSLKEKEILLPDEKEELIKRLSLEMREAAKDLDFETAAIIRDQIKILKR